MGQNKVTPPTPEQEEAAYESDRTRPLAEGSLRD